MEKRYLTLNTLSGLYLFMFPSLLESSGLQENFCWNFSVSFLVLSSKQAHYNNRLTTVVVFWRGNMPEKPLFIFSAGNWEPYFKLLSENLYFLKVFTGEYCRIRTLPQPGGSRPSLHSESYNRHTGQSHLPLFPNPDSDVSGDFTKAQWCSRC